MRRAVVSVVMLLVGLFVGLMVAGCSGDSDQAATTTVATLGDPVPPLPADILPAAFEPGQRGALGNLKATVRPSADGGPGVTVIEVVVENGALVPVVVDTAWFRLYLADGSSVLAAEASGPLVGQELASEATTTVVLTFEHDAEVEPLMLLLDGSWDDRVNSGGFLLEPSATTTPVTSGE
ncbi:MAG: hypothetical protein RJB65_2460 [Actinomycetota bacterium]|jgi:hypothetical protein